MAMSANRKSAPSRAAAGAPKAGAPDAAEVDAAEVEPAEVDAASSSSTPPEDEAEAVEESAPLNRAERRGRARKGANPQVPGRGKVTGRTSGVQGPRLWSNRRGGG
jgi:hypothetical protein